MKINAQGIAILVLCLIVFGLIAYIVIIRQPEKSKAEEFFEQYKIEAARRDSVISILRARNDSLHIERKEIRERLEESQEKTKEQQKSLDVLMYQIAILKRRINENIPNYMESTTKSIDDRLTK